MMPTIDVDGLSINYRLDEPTSGSNGQIVVLSNSLASNYSMWAPQVPALTAAGYRVLRYDTRGHGGSGVPPGDYSIELLADDARGLLDALSIDKVHFCGLSLGGMTGQMFAARYPERVDKLILCATAAYLNVPGVWDERRQTVLDQGIAVIVEPTLQRWFTEQGLQNMETEIRPIRAGIESTPADGYAGCCVAIRDMDLRESNKQIKNPTLVIAGEFDPSTTVTAAEEIRDAIDEAELVVIPNSQHFLNVEKAEDFNNALLAFLQKT